MDPLDITHDDSAGYDIPERPHVEIMFDALNDTIAGTEGFTPAQHYAAGVLSANGFRAVSSVAGVEGFFGSIASGAKQVYDHIIQMFKNVWGFFFKRDAAKQADDAKKDVKAEEVALDKLSAGGPEAEEMAKKALNHIAASKGSEDVIDLDHDTLQDIKRKLDGTPAEKKAAIHELATAMPKVNKRGQERFKKAAAAVMDLNKRFETLVTTADAEIKANTDSDVKKLVVELVTDVAKYLPKVKSTSSALEKHHEVKDIADAKSLHHQVQESIEANRQLISSVGSHNGALGAEIKFYESLQLEPSASAKAGEHLAVLRGILGFSTNVAQYLKRSLTAQVKLSTTVNAVFGL